MNCFRRKIFFKNCSFYVLKDVYEPSDDTFLLAENLVVNEKDVVLDLGAGCGILGILAAKNVRKVVSVDISPQAVYCTKINACINGVLDKMDVRLGDLFQPITKDEKFDTILFNAPYLPTPSDEFDTWIGRTWSGGVSGRQVIDRFIAQAPRYLNKKGTILLVQSTISSLEETIKRLNKAALQPRIIAEKKVSFEKIVVIRAEKP
jgi:release factor glutamine methyltransferase